MRILIVLFFFATFSLGIQAQTQEREQKARLFLKHLEREQFDSCFANFDTILSGKVSPEMLSKIWNSFPGYFGEFKGLEKISSEWKDSLERLTLLCAFEKVRINLNLVYAPNDKIVGITFIPAGSTASYKLPDYAVLSAFTEQKMVVESGIYRLPGVLCVPNAVQHPPLAILLAGSGPNDKDETIGPNKILKDIAVGLGSMGIASFRYDKRSLVYGEELKNNNSFGIQEEVIEDALSAIKMLSKQPEWKSSKLIVIGHSLGGMCAPLIASKSPKVKATVLLAANARPLEDLIAEQFDYLFSLDSIDIEERQTLSNLKRQISLVKDPVQLKTAPDDSLPLGLPSAYWQSLNKYNQVATAKSLKCPLLVLQGKRDYQVRMTDFEIWKSALSGSNKNKLVDFDHLNHLFIAGESKSTPAEYQKQGNVDVQVIRQIADFIKQVK